VAFIVLVVLVAAALALLALSAKPSTGLSVAPRVGKLQIAAAPNV
jgi:hypothetical protein